MSKKSDFKKNTCVYVGSLHEGKGIEIIEKISRKLPKINFHLYGDISNYAQAMQNPDFRIQQIDFYYLREPVVWYSQRFLYSILKNLYYNHQLKHVSWHF